MRVMPHLNASHKEEKEEKMFIAISEYLKPLEEVSQFSAAHVAWTMKHYASGRFLGSGRRVPPVGGVIIARGESQEEFLSILAEDPFQQHGLAKYEVFEFNEGPLPRRSAELEAFLSKPLREEAGE
jgi:uncharacterized protein YciI